MTSPLIDYWNEMRGSEDLPSYDLFDPTALPALLPDILVCRIHREPLDFEYTLVGANVRRIHREDRKGQLMSEIEGQGEGSLIWTFIADTVLRREATTFVSPYSGPIKEIDVVKSYATPWAGADGEVSRLVVHICREHLESSMGGHPQFNDTLP